MSNQYENDADSAALQEALDLVYQAAVHRYPHTVNVLDETTKQVIARCFGVIAWDDVASVIRSDLILEYKQWVDQYPFPIYQCSHCIRLFPASEANTAVAVVEDISIGRLFLCEVCKQVFTAGQTLHHIVLVAIPRYTG